MATVTKTYCDVKDCKSEVSEPDKKIRVAVKKIHEFDGQYTKTRKDPNYAIEDVDLCDEHMNEYIERLQFVDEGDGYEGNEKYVFKGAK